MTAVGKSIACGLAAALAIIAFPAPSMAQAIYRCEQGGKVTFTDSPCDRPLIRQIGGRPPETAPQTQAVVGGGFETPYGPWRGQAQYQVTNIGSQSQATHSVVPLIIEIDEEGKVVGISSENNCKMLGIASPGLTPKMLNLDVTLSGCSAKAMNLRYAGSLSMNSVTRSAQLSLHAQRIGIAQSLIADVKATMRR